MSAAAPLAPRYDPLPWDSAHFGLPVGRLGGKIADEATLEGLLEGARAQGARLVYYLHTQPFTVTEPTLRRYGGRRAAGYVRFAQPLPATPANAVTSSEDVVLAVYAGSTDDSRVLALGLGAGWLSRFRRDDRLPPEKCDELYAIWTRRSIKGELADETLVAWRQGVPVGLITYRARPDRGEIGLLGIAEAARGCGLGRALLGYAHGRMVARGLQRSEVVTQSENQGACRLYQSAGYRPVEQGAYFHFMLAQQEAPWTSR